MSKQLVSIFFSILFFGLITAPSIIIAIDKNNWWCYGKCWIVNTFIAPFFVIATYYKAKDALLCPCFHILRSPPSFGNL